MYGKTKLLLIGVALLLTASMLFACAAPSQTSESQSQEQKSGATSAAEPTKAAEPEQTTEPQPAGDGVTYEIGVIQFVEHAALDAARQGFFDKLDELGVSYNADLQNGQADTSNLKTISQRFVSNKVDLVLAIATGAATSIANETSDIPIVGTAITDYTSFIESYDHPGDNLTGTTDMNPIDKQIDLIQTLVPDAKTVGIIYASGEINSQVQVDIAIPEIEKRGLKHVEATVTSVNDIQQVATSLIGKVDVIYVPTDNIIASAIPNLVSVTEPAGIAVIGGEEGQIEQGATATIGLSYYNLGQQTGEMAYRILVEGANPAEMPIESLSQTDFVYNQSAIDALKIAIPDDLKASASHVY